MTPSQKRRVKLNTKQRLRLVQMFVMELAEGHPVFNLSKSFTLADYEEDDGSELTEAQVNTVLKKR